MICDVCVLDVIYDVYLSVKYMWIINCDESDFDYNGYICYEDYEFIILYIMILLITLYMMIDT